MDRLFDLGLEEYREVGGRFDANARDAALELLEAAPDLTVLFQAQAEELGHQ